MYAVNKEIINRCQVEAQIHLGHAKETPQMNLLKTPTKGKCPSERPFIGLFSMSLKKILPETKKYD